MKNFNVYMATWQPEPEEEPEEESPPSYEDVHDDGNSGYGNSED